ncbi:hypothetical protein C8B47_03640 [filamentous cyanobacterium CCP4]|nr:hypothetical protein C8B47_03640 [filamentous cyanobacterium CCP4]
MPNQNIQSNIHQTTHRAYYKDTDGIWKFCDNNEHLQPQPYSEEWRIALHGRTFKNSPPQWREETAEHAYDLAFTKELEYALPKHEGIADKFARWQGEDGTTHTGRYVMYLEGDDTPHILNQYDTVLVREIS